MFVSSFLWQTALAMAVKQQKDNRYPCSTEPGKGGDGMSKGYGGYAHLIDEDASLLIYSYCAYNVNLPNWREMKEMEDGELWIERSSLVEPEIHEKITRTSSGIKQVLFKRIKRDVPIGELCEAGRIKVRNASGTWATVGPGIDVIAVRILWKLYDQYQENGMVPNRVDWFV